jgi:hypothetical protein
VVIVNKKIVWKTKHPGKKMIINGICKVMSWPMKEIGHVPWKWLKFAALTIHTTESLPRLCLNSCDRNVVTRWAEILHFDILLPTSVSQLQFLKASGEETALQRKATQQLISQRLTSSSYISQHQSAFYRTTFLSSIGTILMEVLIWVCLCGIHIIYLWLMFSTSLLNNYVF